MRNIVAGVAAATLIVALGARAEEKSDFKGPDQDGTKPALTKIAG